MLKHHRQNSAERVQTTLGLGKTPTPKGDDDAYGFLLCGSMCYASLLDWHVPSIYHW